MSWRFVFVSMIAVCVTSVRAADRHFNVGSGLWSSTTSWNPQIVPGPTDHAIVDFFSGGSSALARINTTAIGAVTAVTVTNGATISISNQGSLLVGSDFLAGTNSNWGTLRVQTTNPNIAFPGGLTVATDMRLGVNSGVGVVEQNAGTVNVGREVRIGDSNSSGSMFQALGGYFLSGTGFLRSPRIHVGREATHGTLSVSGFARVQTDRLVLGSPVTLQTSVTGAVNQSNVAQVNVNEYVLLDSNPNGTADRSVYNMNGGTLTTANLWINDRCVFNYNGGSVSAGTLDLFRSQLNMSPGGDKMLAFNNWRFVGSVLDVSDNVVNFRNQFMGESSIRGALRTGYANGAWNGFSLSSSAARNNPAHNTALGYANVSDILEFGPTGYVFRGHNVNGNDIVVAYTYYGDTDLNGVINFDDYARVDFGFNNGGDTWFEGDFNYDGVVNFDDYALIDLGFNTQQGLPFGAPNFSAIPEPSSMLFALLAISSSAFSRRVHATLRAQRANHSRESRG